MKSRVSRNILLLFPLLLAILLMGIGYAVINSVTGEIKGTAIANVQEGVFITNVEYVSNVDANLSNSEIKSYKGTLMQSAVELSSTNPASEIKYKVTVYNNSANSYPFLSVLYDGTNGEFYDNENIIFEIDPSGFNVGDVINANETKEIYITFKYKDGVLAPSAILNSYINFRIAEPNRLVMASSRYLTSSYLNGTIAKEKIESIKFEKGTAEPEGTVVSFDASAKQDNSIIGYYTDVDSNELYELTFLSDEVIAAYKNAQYLFQYLTNLTEIDFSNFSTWGVTNMAYMFQQTGLLNLDLSDFDTSQVTSMESMFWHSPNLTTLDVSGFDTSQVTNMKQMFSSCGALTSLDLSNFNTIQVMNMGAMFQDDYALQTLDLSNFDTSQVTSMGGMFWNCWKLTTLDVRSFDTSQVTSMSFMFEGCKKITTLDLSSFDTSNVTEMQWMFRECTVLTTIYVSEFDSTTNTGWTTSAVTNSGAMFEYSNNIVGGNGTKIDSNYLDGTYARIDTEEEPGYFTNILDKP